MNKFKFEAYLQEFPFLRELYNGNHLGVDDIRVKRADENLLARVPTNSGYASAAGKRELNQSVTFVLADGTIIKDVVTQTYDWSWGSGEWEKHTGESILEALSRVENPDDVKFIVWVETNYENFDAVVDEMSITVYKTPKGTTFGELIEKARTEALKQVRAEADF